jgi:hypothetical protein
MLIYDHDRTDKIVERLRNAEGTVRFITTVSSIALFALVGISISTGADSTDVRVIFGVMGAI